MRKYLERLYYFSAVIAGFCLVAMTLLILSQIVGRWFGIIIPSTEDFSGFLVANAFSLGLAYSFKKGALIRVTLLTSHLIGKKRFFAELFTMLVMLMLASFIVYYFGFIVVESYEFEEVTQGYISIPLWLPQVPVFMGLVIFFIAILDDMLSLLFSGNPSYLKSEETAISGNYE